LEAWAALLSAYEAFLGPQAEMAGSLARRFRLREKSGTGEARHVAEVTCRYEVAADALSDALDRMTNAHLERMAEKGEAVACAECGILFAPKRPDQRYHDAKCAGKARARRHRGKVAGKERITA
jgi:hypothetical protein